jgi:hypothetical protein
VSRPHAAAFSIAAAGVLGLGLPYFVPVGDALPTAGHDAFLMLWLGSMVFGLWYIPARLWGRERLAANIGILVASAACAWLALVVAFVAAYTIRTDNDLCGTAHHVQAIADVSALATYLAVGAAGIRGRRRLLLYWPLAVVAAAAVYLAVPAILPGGSGFCET